MRKSSLCVFLFIFLLRFAWEQESQKTPIYLDPHTEMEARIDDLLSRMTVEEKVGQISDDWGSAGISRLHVPALLKTEALHGQSYSTGATIFPQPIAMGAAFDTDLVQDGAHTVP
jgi:beta-glucosidase